MVIGEPTPRLFNEPFFPRLLRGVSAAISARDLQLVLLMPASPDEARRTGDYLAAGHVDGALLVSLHRADPLPARLASAGVPMVSVGRPPQGTTATYVDVDNRRRCPDGGRAPHRRRTAGRRRRSPVHRT